MRRPTRRTVQAPLSLRLLLETTESDAFVLDGIGAADADGCGEPVVIVLARPETCWFDLSIEQLLKNWAETSKTVTVQVRRGRTGPVAVLEPEQGGSSVHLGLIAVA
jgi:hypothetical protein